MRAVKRFLMIVVSYNIRGLGGRVKRRSIRELVRAQKADFIALQESKLEVVSDALCYSLWGSEDCNWAFLPAVGANGGIISIWSKSNSNLLFTFMGEGFVGVCLEWGVLRVKCFLVNVYSKCDLASKRRLWSNVIRLKEDYGDGLWCVVGDFNAVVVSEERRGLANEVSSSLEMTGFREFIDDLNMIDLPLLGRRYTWFHSNGISMSRLDRCHCFVSLEWLEKWGVASVWVLPREVPDHCPLVLKYSSSD
jgi:exonuclease III